MVLSGADTIGFAHCEQFVRRLYDYHGTKPAIDPKLLKALSILFSLTMPIMLTWKVNWGCQPPTKLCFWNREPRTKSLVQEPGKDKQKFSNLW